MPLLKRKAYSPKRSLPDDLKDDEYLFVVSCTGEGFRSYSEYLGKVRLYRMKNWSCQFTGRAGLSFKEALNEEAKATALLNKFPADYEERVIRSVHCDVSRLEELVNKVYDELRPEEPLDKENGTKPPKQVKHPIPRSVLRRWIQEFAEETSIDGLRVWKAKPELVEKYDLPKDVPVDELRSLTLARAKKTHQGNTSRISPAGENPSNVPSEGGRSSVVPGKEGAPQELSSKLKPGGMTHTAFLVLWELGRRGGRVDDIVARSAEKGIKTVWDAQRKKSLRSCLSSNPKMFARLDAGLYALRMFVEEDGVVDKASGSGEDSLGPAKEENGDSICQPTPGTAFDEAMRKLKKVLEEEHKIKSLRTSLQSQLPALEERIENMEVAAKGKQKKVTGKKSKELAVLLESKQTVLAKLEKSSLEMEQIEENLLPLRDEVCRARSKLVSVEAVKAALQEIKKLDREEQRKLEKERKRLEALEAKRYPIDDLQLLEENMEKARQIGVGLSSLDVFRPTSMLPKDTTLTSSLLYVSEFLTQFGKQLGLRAFGYSELQSLLLNDTGNSAPPIPERMIAKSGATSIHLGTVYEKLLSIVLDEATAGGEGTRHERRWCYVLGPGTWPEVLRRYVLGSTYARGCESLVSAARELQKSNLQNIPTENHLELLEFLCEEVLTTEKLRDILQNRMDSAETLARSMRVELTETKQKLKELLDAEKEERKRKREEQAAAKRATAEQGKATVVENGNGVEDGVKAEEEPDKKKQKLSNSENTMETDLPCFELPPELREYKGSPSNRRQMSQFRQKQQAEKRRLEKEQRRWEAEERKRLKALEIEERARKEMEVQKKKEKEAAEEAVSRVQDLYEKQLAKVSLRSDVLGYDRHHQHYWWALGSHHPVIYVEDGAGQWGCFNTIEELLKLRDSLDEQGVRELRLRESLDQRWETIEKAMKKASKQAETSSPPPVPKRELPKRAAKQSTAVCTAPKKVHVTPPFGDVDVEAITMLREALDGMSDMAVSLKMKGPQGGWRLWQTNVSKLLLDDTSPQSSTLVEGAREKLLEFEDYLISGTGEKSKYQNEDEDEDASDDDSGDVSVDDRDGACVDSDPDCGMADEDSENGHVKSALCVNGGSAEDSDAAVEEHLESDDDFATPSWCVWNGIKERQSWRADTTGAAALPQLAYCVSSLEESAVPALEELTKRQQKKKQKK
ncbi:hypothetical protein BSKO_09871 [Bryopsis sp. KO-2023]|nr:hypothetical protein BSKO_09871 [Bryopsis sp. KO-2023]